ncbi:hypothetical protein PSE10B_46300 [Pseudomonas amygdali pv. eriobotryae]|nr:hypothetical protein PSE10B_46300 [Pseudomonas amygdali pv. eriobotryae]
MGREAHSARVYKLRAANAVAQLNFVCKASNEGANYLVCINYDPFYPISCDFHHRNDSTAIESMENILNKVLFH